MAWFAVWPTHVAQEATITAFECSPDGDKATRVRWALAEAGQPHEVRLVCRDEGARALGRELSLPEVGGRA